VLQFLLKRQTAFLNKKMRRRRAARRTVAPGTNRRGRATADSRLMKHAAAPRRGTA
jgi:hypothetical protein